MSTNSNQDQEIDLGQVFSKIGNFIDGFGTSIFRAIQYLKKNWIILVSLFLIGSGISYFLDFNTNKYDQEIIVTPNFGCVDYLYNKVRLVNARIKQNDTLFLKSIGINDSKKISKISISPIVDIYSFVNSNTNAVGNAQNSQNFELVKLLSEDGDINKVIKDSLTSRNYGHHRIKILTKGLASSKTVIDPILVYLNQSEFYSDLQKTFVDNIKIKIKEDQVVINQIDDLLNQFSSNSGSQKNDKLVYYNENTQLNDIISNKNSLISEIGYLKTQLISTDKVIQDKSRVLNIKNNKGLLNKLIQFLPFLLLIAFVLFGFLKSFYKNQEAKFSK